MMRFRDDDKAFLYPAVALLFIALCALVTLVWGPR